MPLKEVGIETRKKWPIYPPEFQKCFGIRGSEAGHGTGNKGLIEKSKRNKTHSLLLPPHIARGSPEYFVFGEIKVN